MCKKIGAKYVMADRDDLSANQFFTTLLTPAGF